MSVKEISKTYPLKTISGDIKSALNKEFERKKKLSKNKEKYCDN